MEHTCPAVINCKACDEEYRLLSERAFNIEELKALFELVKWNWINPENVLGNQTVNRIMKIIAEHEQSVMDRHSSSST